MNKKDVRNILEKEMNALANISKDYHKDVLKDRMRCTEEGNDPQQDKDYQTHSRLQRSFEDQAFEVLNIMQKLGLITQEQREARWHDVWNDCHAYDEVIG